MFGRGGKRRGSRSKRNVSSKRKHTDAATGATALLVSPSNPRPGFTPYTTPNKRKTKKASRRGRGKRKGKSRAARPTTSMSVGSGDVLSMSERDRRIGIAHFFIESLDAPPPEAWDDDDDEKGTISRIIEAGVAKKGSRSVVRGVLEGVMAAAAAGKKYDGSRKPGSGGHNVNIPFGSAEAQIVCDGMEDGRGLDQTLEDVNEDRTKRGLEEIGKSSVRRAAHGKPAGAHAAGHLSLQGRR